jgi:hypothetical protein
MDWAKSYHSMIENFLNLEIRIQPNVENNRLGAGNSWLSTVYWEGRVVAVDLRNEYDGLRAIRK